MTLTLTETLTLTHNSIINS